jgi:hypothetical protein
MGVGTAFPRGGEMGDRRFSVNFSKSPSSILDQKAQRLQTILSSDQGGKCTGQFAEHFVDTRKDVAPRVLDANAKRSEQQCVGCEVAT